ncbi:hypothetical protein Pmani_010767 [Petrolisthes manimaculis]|uniref:dual-specificity kinase n=1 Tax=Petrolisthes manimaculis TaxID=1843537 RepID=A0AAE1UGD7_9EUCA|nr:hypothetical protein Pmani_010767 [Petrolisthes manimaculis]
MILVPIRVATFYFLFKLHVEVRHRVTGDVMVLKMNKLLSNRHNMLREVELMNRLHHPNILSYYGVCVNEGQVHALTEYINGGSLDALIGNHAVVLPWSTRVSLALDVARGMAYLHSRGVFHRDLTSKNVLIKHTMDGGEHKLTAVIADFGLAAPIPHEKCVRLRQVGSPYWMAPEVIRGDWYDHRVDVFSFGIIVCELIARCEADPDILPRTHNFGVHYLDFYDMCQQDCPAFFLQIAFECCQIEPASRPSFEELTGKLELLLHQLTVPPSRHTPRKLKACHRRSLSDDTFKVMRHQLGESICVSGHQGGGGTGSGNATLTPQEIAERMSAADPYFQPSSSTVNPFTLLKLPARSQLALQEGGRYCHSLPDYPAMLPQHTGMGSPRHIHTSDSCLCHNSTTAPCQCRNHRQFSAQVDGGGKHCQCVSGIRRIRAGEKDIGECRCRLGRGCGEGGTVVWQHNGCRVGRENGSAISIPRSDPGSGGGEGGAGPGPVRRRGSGESGFFSVGDVERPSTPDLCLSYSELSTASLASTEDEEHIRHRPAQRSSSVVTDSSEDLSSLGCCHDPHTPCDLAMYNEGEDGAPGSRLSDYEVDTDIRQIVEFFERSIRWSGTAGSGSGPGASSRLRQGCMVPLLTHKFSALHSAHRPPCPLHNKSLIAKDHPRLRQPYARRDTFRVKDRPKVYITEGTVRAKRDIFEPK